MTYTVTSAADDGSAGTLRWAIAEANAGANTIKFLPAVFGTSTAQTITLAGSPLELGDTTGALTIIGPSAGVTISANGQSRVLEIGQGVNTSITGLNFKEGEWSQNGAGLYNSGTLSLTDCIISGNSAGSSSGGGLFNTGTATLTNCYVSGNEAGTGAGLDNHGGTMTLADDCTVSGNGSGNQSGGTNGGGIFNTGNLSLTDDCTVTGNLGYTGGGIDNSGTVALMSCTLDSNHAKYGGGLNNGGIATFTDCTVSTNKASNGGGGLKNFGTLNLSGCLVSGNAGGTECGGIYVKGGTATVTDCTISGNYAQLDAGAFLDAKSYLYNCTISGNYTTSGHAGGVYCGDNVADLTDCTITGNAATKNGGGIYSIGPTILTTCTISGNSANNGGGVYNKGSTLLKDTIVAGNFTNSMLANDIQGAHNVSGDHNLIGAGGAGGLQPKMNGNIVLGDLSTLRLAPLGFYGGPTQTMALLPGSAAIGNGGVADYPGTTTPITTDQRGYPLDLPAPDIGAFQTQIALVVNTTSDASGGSPLKVLSLRQAVNLANVLGGAETIIFDSADFASAQTITLAGSQLELSDTSGTVTIFGPAAGLTLSGGGSSRVLQIDASVIASISGLSITAGSAADGGGVYNQGNLALTDCTISGNSATNNGGGLGGNGTAALIDCTISGNSAADGGGLAVGGMVSLTGCTVSANYASTNGGGLFDEIAPTLEDTIVAGNTGSGGSASDTNGSVASSSSYNLIGNGGSGGLSNGVFGNIVGVANPELAPLGDYGGRSETMALLPGSPAIGAGTGVSGITTDERAASRPSSGGVDIGAFQNEGYTLSVSSGSPQSTLVGEAFSSPLVTLVTENFVNAPLPGATIAFTARLSGASATLSASSAVTDANGLASVIATANATAGPYAVTASTTGVALVSFNLTNQIQPNFSGLTNPTVTYGSTVTFTGVLAAGTQVPVGQNVAITVHGVTQDATVGSDGSFQTQFTPANVVLNASSTAYNVTYAYATDGVFLTASGSSQLTVNPAALTITAVASSKVYDGTTSAAADPIITSGNVATGDTPDFTESFSTRNVGTGLTLTPSGTVNDGNGGRNYTYLFVPVPTGVITPAVLTITSTGDARVYNGTTTSSKIPTYQVSGEPVNTLYDGNSLTGLTQAFASKNALGTGGSTLVVQAGYTVNDGDGGTDYSVTAQIATGTITAATLTITAATDSKVYDGTTTSSQTPTYQVSGEPIDALYNGDTVSGLTQAFVSKSVLGADGSTLVVTSYAIDDGDDGKDYAVTTPNASGTITPAALSIDATSDTKVYDGTTTSSLSPTYGTLYDGDTVTGLTQAFASKNVLGVDNSTLEVTGYTVNDGDDGNDYTVTTQEAPGTITHAALTISATGETKVYNGTTSSSQTPTYGTLYSGDTITGLTQAFTTKNVLGVDNSTLIVTGYTVNDGDDGNDYTVTTQEAHGTITPAALAITATSDSKVYDGTATSSKNPTYGTLYFGDTVTGLTQAFTSKNVLGTGGSTLEVTGYKVNDGDGGNDYTVNTKEASGTVTPAALVITATSDTKLYDGSTSSSQTPTCGTLFGGDTVTGLTEAFTSKNVLGVGNSTLKVTGYTINDGDGGKDYTVTTRDDFGSITPETLTISATSDIKVYDGTTASSKTPTYGTPYRGDTVTGLTQAFASKNVLGTNGSTLTVTGYTVNDGNDGKNYTVTTQNASGTVTPAPLTITANDQTKVYGAALSALTAGYSGLVSGDKPASFSTPPTLSTTASAFSSVIAGGYPITASGAIDPNYTITYAPGTLSVTRAATQVVLITEPVFKKKHKLVSLGLTVEVQPIAPGAGVPTGTATFEVQVKVRLKKKKELVEKPLGTVSLNGGSGTLSVKPKSVLKKPITIIYGGDADFTGSSSPSRVLTSA